jgi:hypothetical protein
MSQLTHNTAVSLTQGDYVITTVIGTGTTTVQISVEGAAYIDVDSALSGSDSSKYTFPTCSMRVALTGDAVAYYEKLTARANR